MKPVHFNGLTFYETSPAKTEVLVFLHGFMGSHRDWLFLLPQLQNFKCIFIDFPGHGLSKISTDARWSFVQTSAVIKAFLESRNIQSATFIGYSLGGRAALHLACTHPQVVNRLLLESTSTGIENASEREARYKQDTALAEKLRNAPLRSFLNTWYTLPLFADISKHENYETMLENRLQNDPQALAKSMELFSPAVQPFMGTKLHHLSMPVSLVCGAKDQKYKTLMQRIHKQFPHFDLKIIPNCGHNAHFEAPVLFAEHLLQFLSLQITKKD